jgi:type VI secretion system protein ImpE
MLAFAGDLDRARRQIDAIQHDEPELIAAVLDYKMLLDAEQARRRLFADGLVPKYFGEPPEHCRLRLEAINRLRENHPEEAAKTLAQAAEATPAIKGKLNDKPFDSLRDCDDILAGVLEVMAKGAYYWVPLDQVDALLMNPPRFPRDLLWFPARLEMKDDAAGNVYLPALYPGSHQHPDPQVKLGRMTDWKETPNGPTLGLGLHMFLVGEEPINLLEWRELLIES